MKHKEKLKKALRIIPDQGFVHGDVRWPNILISKDEINFVDFDHCGKEGVQRYQWEWDHMHRLEDAKEGDLMMRMLRFNWTSPITQIHWTAMFTFSSFLTLKPMYDMI